jgi:hypothetical protein
VITSADGLTYRLASQAGPNPLSEARVRVANAYRKLQAAKTDEAVATATSETREALSEYFDRDLESRQKELDEVRHGLEEMKNKLKKRADAKEEILALQIQMLENEADGLGFFSGADPTRPRSANPANPLYFVPQPQATPANTSPSTLSVPRR